MKYYKHNDFQPETNFKHTMLNTYERKTNKTCTENPKGMRLSVVKFHTDLALLCTDEGSIFPPRKAPPDGSFTCSPARAPPHPASSAQ